MTRLYTRFLALCLVFFAACPVEVHAQEKDPAPSVTIVQAGADRLLEDLEYIVNLDEKNGAAQWPGLAGIINVFTGGIDTKKPIRIDILPDTPESRYRTAFPISKFSDFDENLGAFGIATKKLSKDYYQLKGEVFPGFLRMVDGYAVIGQVKTDVPDDLPNPLDALKPLIELKYDLAAHIQNLEKAPKDQDKRRESFEAIRKELMGAVSKKKEESEADFDIRKLAIEQQLAEMERFFVESSEIILGWTTDVEKEEGRLDIKLTPIEGTSLAKTIEELAVTPSLFANVKFSENSILSLRLNHALDEMRTGHMGATLDLLQPSTQERLDNDEGVSGDEKASLKQALDLLFTMTRDGVGQGKIDGFADISQNDEGVRSMVGGVRVPDAGRVLEIIKLLPAKSGAHTTELNADKVGEVDIHRVAPPSIILEKLDGLFADDAPLYVASTEQAVWYAVGSDGLAAMKATLGNNAAPKQTVEKGGEKPAEEKTTEKAGEEKTADDAAEGEKDAVEKKEVKDDSKKGDAEKPEAEKGEEKKSEETPVADAVAVNPTFFELRLRAGPWAEFRSQQRGSEGNADFRKMMTDAFKDGDDSITFKLDRVDGHVEGKMRIGPSIFRLVGMLIADFAKNNL